MIFYTFYASESSTSSTDDTQEQGVLSAEAIENLLYQGLIDGIFSSSGVSELVTDLVEQSQQYSMKPITLKLLTRIMQYKNPNEYSAYWFYITDRFDIIQKILNILNFQRPEDNFPALKPYMDDDLIKYKEKYGLTESSLVALKIRGKVKDFKKENPLWEEGRSSQRAGKSTKITFAKGKLLIDTKEKQKIEYEEGVTLKLEKEDETGNITAILKYNPEEFDVPHPFIQDLEYDPKNQALIFNKTVKAKEKDTEIDAEVPFKTQYFMLRKMVEFLGSPITIKKIVRSGITNSTTQEALDIIEKRKGFRKEGWDRKLFLRTPNGRNTLDLLRYITGKNTSDLSLEVNSEIVRNDETRQYETISDVVITLETPIVFDGTLPKATEDTPPDGATTQPVLQ